MEPVKKSTPPNQSENPVTKEKEPATRLSKPEALAVTLPPIQVGAGRRAPLVAPRPKTETQTDQAQVSERSPFAEKMRLYDVDTEAGVLRGRAPISEEELAKLKEEHGITDVIDLRAGMAGFVERRAAVILREDGLIGETEEYNEGQRVAQEAEWAQELGITAHHVPMRLFLGTTSQERIDKLVSILKEVAADPERKAYIHCAEGKNRTAIASGIHKVLVGGEDKTEVYKEYILNFPDESLGFTRYRGLTSTYQRATGFDPRSLYTDEE